MRKYVALVAVLISIFILGACSTHEGGANSSNSKDNSTIPEYITMIEDGVWPENEYTEGLPVPPGTIDWVMLDSKQKICGISIIGMNEESYQEYMRELKELGFAEIHSVSEEIKGEDYISIGTTFSNGTKALSIAYAGENMSIYIPNNNN